jgi:hypothetical protein
MTLGGPRHAVWSAVSGLASRLLSRGDRRKRERTTANAITCNRGTIIDFSTAGMRLRSRGLYTGTIDVDLSIGERHATFQAEVIWSKRLGFGKFEMGLAFRNLTPKLQAVLAYFAHNKIIG